MEKRMKTIAEEKKTGDGCWGYTAEHEQGVQDSIRKSRSGAYGVVSWEQRCCTPTGRVPGQSRHLRVEQTSRQGKGESRRRSHAGDVLDRHTSFVAPTTTATTSTSQASTPPPLKMKPAFSRVTVEPVHKARACGPHIFRT
ncbi:unnamed protein product [Rhizoctonia solani]|uniref:Uncharacterized protein n=1 Tax=Rhizoctonia solani TaxID=456999 RepID=A0A8H3E5A2_9AGAM|nr:unnamed protein product [Rhizoctonia solani]